MYGIAAGGEGVARLPDGMTVFVPRTAAGDVAQIELTERHRRWGRARLVEVVRPGPGRVAPVCPHYERDGCGGCQLQHLALARQHGAKRLIVREALRRLGGREAIEPELVPAPDAFGYRSKITLAARDGRLGFHRFDHPPEVFDLEECPIAAPALMEVWKKIRAARSALPAGMAGIVLRLDRDGNPHIVVRGGSPPWDARPFVGELASDRITVWWQPARGAPRAVAGRASGFPALAFLQVNPGLADVVRRDAVSALGVGPGRVAWDLYGGVGDGARLLVARGATVWSVDADRSAIAWARTASSDISPAPTFLHGRVEEVLHRLPPPGVVLLNPPRAGAAAQVTQALERLARTSGLGRVAYVSCDPATLARDLRRLPAFRLERVVAYDLFPQTAHVEVLAVLEAP